MTMTPHLTMTLSLCAHVCICMYLRRMRVMRIYIKCGEFHIGGSTDNDPVFVCTQTYMYVRVKTECNALHSFFTRV